MMWLEEEFEDIIDFFGGSVPDILIGLIDGYDIKSSDAKKTIRKTDEIAKDFAKKQADKLNKVAEKHRVSTTDFENWYRSPYESIVKNDIESITEIGDGISKLGVIVKFKDGDKQKVLTDDIEADIDTSILLCVLKHAAKIDGDKNGSHALNRIMLAIKKKREKIMTSSIENTLKKGLNKDRKKVNNNDER